MIANRVLRTSVPIFVVVLGACYSFAGVGGRPLTDGADLQLDLAPPRDVTLQEVTLHGITGLQGRALPSDTESLAVAVSRLWGLEGRSYEATGIGVRLPRSDISAVRVKRLSPARSALAATAGTAAVVAAILGIRHIVGSSGGSRPKPLP